MGQGGKGIYKTKRKEPPIWLDGWDGIRLGVRENRTTVLRGKSLPIQTPSHPWATYRLAVEYTGYI